MKISEIFTFENLKTAHNMCRRSKQHKRGTAMFELDLPNKLVKLCDSLVNKKYKIGKYVQFKMGKTGD